MPEPGSATPCSAALVLPGLFEPPGDAAAKVSAPLLSRLIARATTGSLPTKTFEETLHLALKPDNSSQGSIPAAAYLWQYKFGGLAPTGCLCADPVFLQIDRDHARLIEGDALQLGNGEAQSLLETINKHFGEDGIELRSLAPQQWLLTSAHAADVDMRPPGFAAGRNVFDFLPSGASARHWKVFLNELQMVLHDHPVNRQRQAQGQFPVNSIWLWGGGELPDQANATRRRTLYSNCDLAFAIGAHFQFTNHSLPDNANAFSPTDTLVYVDDSLLSPAIYGESRHWLQAVERLEKQCIEPLLNSMQHGLIKNLQLYPCNGQRIEVCSADLKKFWRKRKPLAAFFTSARATL